MASDFPYADTVLMIRPASFGFNESTAGSNQFQRTLPGVHPNEIQARAVEEFDRLCNLLRDSGVEVIAVEDTPDVRRPDAIFPNNWFSTEADGTIVLYPMEGENRRRERRTDILERLRHSFGYGRILDLTAAENDRSYLEGTGSMVLDRRSMVVYACLSSRTDPRLLERFAAETGYRSVISFHADIDGPVYHTNVVMAVGASAAVICTEAIRDGRERARVVQSLENNGREVVELSVEQIQQFAGNMLQLRSRQGVLLWVMSTSAYKSLTPAQRSVLGSDGSELIHSLLPTIETVGGGSARCMLAEIFRPEDQKGRIP